MFQCPAGPIVLSERCALGAYICRSVRTSDRPTQKTGVALDIPSSQDRHLDRHFLYFTKSDEASIFRYVDADLELELKRFYIEARYLGFDMKTAINAFISAYDFEGNKFNYEMIRKRITRENERKRNILMQYVRENPCNQGFYKN